MFFMIALFLGSFTYTNAQTNFNFTDDGENVNFEIDNTIEPSDYDGKVFNLVARPTHYINVSFNNEYGFGGFTLGVDDGVSTSDIIHMLCDLFNWNYP
ncbi:MAG TPA: hypothetical protein PKX92_12245 [Edaphocola sp.]|nr:hypothetical protein [Edaphocola sp.]